MGNSVKESAIARLTLLVTVVDRTKGEFFMDVISQFEVNCQLSMPGMGTASSDLIDMLGLTIHKAVIFSVVRDDQIKPILSCLEDKFGTIKNGKGIAFAVPMSSVIGVNLYRFFSNNRVGGEK